MNARLADTGQGAAALPSHTAAGWLELWYEPWRSMHPAWLDAAMDDTESADAAPWLARFRSPGPALRLAYRWFCERFGIDADLPLPVERLEDLPAPVPLEGTGLDRAALALGRVGYASHCLDRAHRELAQLFSPKRGDAPMWCDALRQATPRPLLAAGPRPPSPADADLRRWALPLMAGLVEDAMPGAWPRLRLRFAPDLAMAAPAVPRLQEPAAALRRQAWRIWRTGGSAPPPSLPSGPCA